MKRPFLVLMLALLCMPVVGVAVLSLTRNFESKELQIFGEVPPFSLTERSGKSLSREELRGKVWIASFVFTHCAGQCPTVVASMQRLQRALRFKENFRLVSVSVDPERDTPLVLAEYAQKASADPYKWLFLTGNKNEINALVANGFRLSSGGDDAVNHSSHLVLVDGWGKIRGYYDAMEEGSVTTLLRDAKGLIRKTF
jgi:protein SCO1/2